jgi:hypothetical protein
LKSFKLVEMAITFPPSNRAVRTPKANLDRTSLSFSVVAPIGLCLSELRFRWLARFVSNARA